MCVQCVAQAAPAVGAALAVLNRRNLCTWAGQLRYRERPVSQGTADAADVPRDSVP